MPINPSKQETGLKPLTSIFFLIDSSGSMEGQPIQAVNTAMREAILEVQNFARDNADNVIKYSILEFNTIVRWMSKKPSNVEDFVWTDLKAGGVTNLGAAYSELSSKLSRSEFLQEHANNAPIIILLSDGVPTDSAEDNFNKVLLENVWFKSSIRIAIELPGANHNTLLQFTGSEESVISTDTQKLRNLLKIVAINSAVIGSTTKSRNSKDVQKEVVDSIKEDITNRNQEDAISNNENGINENIFDDPSVDWS